MVAQARPRGWYLRHPVLADAALVAVILPFVLLFPDPNHGTSVVQMSAWVMVLSIATCVLLPLRSRLPAPVLAATTAGVAVSTLLATGRTPLTLVALLALYTVAVRTDRRSTLWAWGGTAVVLTTAVAVAPHGQPIGIDLLSYSAWAGLAAALGDGLRNRRAYVAAVEERADRAEQTREQETLRQVAEERLRIARELHDVVAHHMAVVNVQAGVAGHLLSSNPAAADEALGHVRRASRAVLDELSGILAVLRDPSDSSTSTHPAPGLAQAADLLESFAAAGLLVTWSQDGSPRPLGAAADLVAFRVLQEALTNAHKHGCGTAQVQLVYTSSTVKLTVTNSVAIASSERTGHGLIGMRERAAAVGGRLTAAVGDDGLFHVLVQLPLPIPAYS